MTPTFNHLPAIDCPAWAPKAVQAEYAALVEAQAAIETKRAEVLETLRKARNQDLAVFTPVQYDPRPMMQGELLHRRAVTAYFRNLQAAASTYKDKCNEEAAKAREDVKKQLLKMGYLEPGNVPIIGAYTPEFILRHPTVRCAENKHDNASRFSMAANIQENLQAITDLESKLRALIVAAS